ncbi:MAG TPA: lamin tail domain-containing protein [Chloroflexia bacterium]|jgi:hypothetical protein|nr:lamin tail domain-containing protein [Chloroflexia bacterium]
MNRRTAVTIAVLLLVFLAIVVLTRPDNTPAPSQLSPTLPTATLANSGDGTRGLEPNPGSSVVNNPGGGIPVNAPKPPPPPTNYKGCPAIGDGGDPQLNLRKNRTDSAPWYPVAVSSLLNLQWPKGIERRNRANWTRDDAVAVAQYEGIPVQIEGWLAGAKQQGPESCNCHSADDVDNHLWVVDDPSKDRNESIVAEITPRVRAEHPGWAFSRVRPLVDGQTKVRISGWLLMDQEHPEQLGKTRGSIWEIHPIIAFDVLKGNQWVSLDTGEASRTITADAVPTEDPNLPPPIVETPEPGARPTATPLPPMGESGGHGTTLGPIQISDIFYDGTRGQNEPDEYVEVSNTGNTPVNMDGWVLHDIYGGQDFTWHNFTIQPGQKIRVYTDEVHSDSGGFSFGSGTAIWANKGDAAELRDATGTVVSTFTYGSKR